MRSSRVAPLLPLLLVAAAACGGGGPTAPNNPPPSNGLADLGTMNVGDVRVLTFADAKNGLTIPDSLASAQYVVVAANVAGDTGSVPTFTVTGNLHVAPAPSQAIESLASRVLRPSYSGIGGPRARWIAARMQAYEHTRLRLPRPAGSAYRLSLRANRVPAGTIPTVGSEYQFNVPGDSGDICTNYSTVTARVETVSTHAIIVTDTTVTANFTAATYDSIASEFDNYIYPTEVGYFGLPTDIDRNGHVFILYTPAVNKLTPPNTASTQGYTGGFTFPGDFFPDTTEAAGGCPESNQGEIFYILAPDPTGQFGNDFSRALVREVSRGTIAHEFQHAINAGNRYVNNAPAFESAWLDEALSSLAEGAVGRAELGYGDLKTLTLNDMAGMDSVMFNTFFSDNLARAKLYVIAPDTIGPLATDARVEKDLAAFGAGWAFLRYVDDWFSNGSPRTLTQALVAGPDTGQVNLVANAGAPLDTLLSRWLVTMYTDGQPIPALPAQYNYKSYNLRDIVSALCLTSNCSGPKYLPVTSIGSGTTSVTVGIPSSSADYFMTTGGTGARTIKILGSSGSPSTYVYGRLYIIRTG